jgi:hypothetical protein
MRRVALAVLVLSILSAVPLFAADSWVATYGVQNGTPGGEGAHALAVTASGYALGGPTNTYSGNGQSNFWLVQTDALGSVTSQRSYYTQPADVDTNMFSLLATSDGGFLMAGQVGSSSDGLIVKVDSTGAVQWSKRYGNTPGGGYAFNRVIATTDGGYAIAGIWGNGMGLVKLDSGGSITFSKRYKGTTTDPNNAAVDLIEVSDGYVVLGVQTDSTPQSDIRLLKTDLNGGFVWEKTYGGPNNETPGGLASTGDGGFIFTGMTESFGGEQVWVVRVDSSGAIVWQKSYVDTYSATHVCAGNKIIPTADGGFLVAGLVATGDAGLYKLDTNGVLKWEKDFSTGNGTSIFNDVVQKSDGSYVGAGFSQSGFMLPDADLLLQLGPNGEFTGCIPTEWTKTAEVATTVTAGVATTITETPDNPSGVTVIDAMALEHTTSAPSSSCTNVLPPFLSPSILLTDVHIDPSHAGNGNGVAEPNEGVVVEPSWTNTGGTLLPLSSTTPEQQDDQLTNFDAGNTAGYGTVAAGATADCWTATGNCFVAITPPNSSRPQQHWDIQFDETLNKSWAFRWTMHVGLSFADEPDTDQFYKYIETLFHNGITGGCGSGNYCPTANVTRSQMAVFLLKGEHGGSYAPPTCSGTVFADVPCPGSPNVNWINQLHAEGVTGGCGGGDYCPTNPVTRAQMAVFLLKAQHGGAYTPPTCSATVFADVPCPGAQFVDWINQLHAEGITGGCGGGDYCPTSPVTRGQMAVFLTRTFALQLNAILP